MSWNWNLSSTCSKLARLTVLGIGKKGMGWWLPCPQRGMFILWGTWRGHGFTWLPHRPCYFAILPLLMRNTTKWQTDTDCRASVAICTIAASQAGWCMCLQKLWNSFVKLKLLRVGISRRKQFDFAGHLFWHFPNFVIRTDIFRNNNSTFRSTSPISE